MTDDSKSKRTEITAALLKALLFARNDAIRAKSEIDDCISRLNGLMQDITGEDEDEPISDADKPISDLVV